MKILILFSVFLGLCFTLKAQENKIDAKGRKQGRWVKYVPNTKVVDYEGTFINDKPNGDFTYYYRNGKVKAKMFYKDSGIVCYTTFFHEDEYNNPMASGKYINQQKDSVWTYWGPSGRISMMETFKFGVLDGKKIIYYVPEIVNDKTILIAQDLFYKDGKKHGEQKEYFDNGVLKSKTNYVNDKIEGIVITNGPNGNIAMKDNYVNGLRDGWCFAYDEKGIEISKVLFKKGVKLNEKQIKAFMELNKK